MSSIYLRPLTPEDIDDVYVSWFRDDTVTAFLEAKNISRKDAIAYLSAGRDTNTYYMYAIIHRESGTHIGNVKVGCIDWKNRVSDLVTVIGRREFWGRGLAEQAIRAGHEIAFNDFDLRKLSGGVVEGNDGSLKAYGRAGWVVEGRQVGHLVVEGIPKDRIIISCFNPKYFPERNNVIAPT